MKHLNVKVKVAFSTVSAQLCVPQNSSQSAPNGDL